jgi:hypothetical protein
MSGKSSIRTRTGILIGVNGSAKQRHRATLSR